MWDVWWVWMAGAVVLFILELFAPGYIFLGFAAGAAVAALVVGFVAGISLPQLLVVFAVASLMAWLVMRKVFGLRGGGPKIFDRDINDD
ncbi:hypothetical protein [Actibacterium sp. XHP0104]|uniref:hypothetical protein n=1 Tax=Actibacterium sp. XHP0104 TaxID=2984335 RepID=UPI0021E82913|nr:hypothetical protein [Actibacterium sp. XHP0104]MCV2881899.1 hypothetical protein [Actibacterium sp. XHP0104]